MKKFTGADLAFAGCGVLALAACNLTTAQQATLATAIQGVTTLGAVAAGNNTTAQAIIAAGQLVCTDGKNYAAVLGVNVTGTPATFVNSVCAGLGSVPAALPTNIAADVVPVVTALNVALTLAGK